MNALLALSALALVACVPLIFPGEGPAAATVFVALAGAAALVVSRHESESRFLVRVFVAAALVRAAVGSFIYYFQLQDFFGGDAYTYDYLGTTLTQFWKGNVSYAYYEEMLGFYVHRNWGMPYTVGALYMVTGRNMLAVQMFNAVVGAATAPLIFLCARHIFQNMRVAKVSTLFVAFFPSLVLWSSQGLKDGPIVFLLVLTMLATLKAGEKVSLKYGAVLVFALYGLLCFRFYIFYMAAAAVGGAFLIGMRRQTTRSLLRQFAVILALGVGLTYMGVLRTAENQVDTYADFEAIQRSRRDLSRRANSGFGQDVDVSTATGALTAVPLGMTYLLFAPFPWQLASLRQSITLPEMVIWWVSFPLLVTGIWFTLKFRLRQALPILIFTSMLTLAYSIFQGNVGTAYRQRSQILVFYFIFVAVGAILMREKRENRRRQEQVEREAELAAIRAARLAPLSLERPRPRAALGPAPHESRDTREVTKV
ncbi:MAG TPA: glycosyltransferase family 39 protein [Pyrinomonadaceae bacterium]|nr:glycosyltransferase family 39 protein [Pyrinomonadaceae bacterium]